MQDRPGRILLVEDEPAIADTLLFVLSNEGYDVTWKGLAREGLQCAREWQPDLAILDVGLPDGSGFDLCREIRAFSNLPILFLTARSDEIDRIVGLEIGGDDYVTKPFSPREVAARVRVILRRVRESAPTEKDTEAGLTFQPDAFLASIAGQPLNLTRYEYLILQLLHDRPGRVWSRQQIMDQIWDEPDGSFDRAVDTHIKTLRAKLRQAGAEEVIRTHRGLGYSFSPSS